MPASSKKSKDITAADAGFTNQVGYQLLIQSAIISLMKKINDESRKAAAGTPAESMVTIADDNGVSYGTISRNKTSIKASVSDIDVIKAENPGLMKLGIDPDKVEDLIDYLVTNGKDDAFLTEVPDEDKLKEISDQVLTDYTNNRKQTPGWEVKESQGNLVMKPSDAAHAVALDYAKSIGMVPQDS